MPKRKSAKPPFSFGEAARLLETLLHGTARGAIVDELATSRDGGGALERLRAGMRSHRFQTGATAFSLERLVHRFDALNHRDGFHVLNDWDGVADQHNADIIPVDVLSFVQRADTAAGAERTALAVLLDYYVLYLLALLSLRVWDEGDANENLDELQRLLGELQGPKGSGQRFVSDAETLILLATSHFEADESAYDRLLDRVRNLDEVHRTRLALAHAAILSSHLRFGFEATYARDIVAMRKDNVADYPWLLFALRTLLEVYARLCEDNVSSVERDRVVEGLVNGLSPDPRAFVGEPPPALAAHEAELGRFRQLFREHRTDLLEEFVRFAPSEASYSPISFYFNFTHNLLKAVVVDALLRGEPWRTGLNDLLTGVSVETEGLQGSETLARTLMAYARSSPDRYRGRLVPVIVYDPRKGRRAFSTTLEKLAQPSSPAARGTDPQETPRAR